MDRLTTENCKFRYGRGNPVWSGYPPLPLVLEAIGRNTCGLFLYSVLSRLSNLNSKAMKTRQIIHKYAGKKKCGVGVLVMRAYSLRHDLVCLAGSTLFNIKHDLL